jgi:hypothetical protein
MRFTDAGSFSGICTPSRYALLTERYHRRDFQEVMKSFCPLRVQGGDSSPSRNALRGGSEHYAYARDKKYVTVPRSRKPIQTFAFGASLF